MEEPTPREKTAHFGARARVVDLLGRQQIADAATAVSELLKNSVDALASKATVNFDTHHSCLQVEDDGLGMRTSDLLDKWLILATESKQKTPDSEKETENYRQFATEERVKKAKEYPPLGEKGIGRLAVAALGRGVLVWTRWGSGEQTQRTLLFIHWALFEHPRLSLNDIIVPYLELADRTATVDDALVLFAQIENWVYENDKFWVSDQEKEIRELILEDVHNHFFSYLAGDIRFSPDMGTLFCVLGVRDEVESIFEEPKLSLDTTASESDGIRLLLGFCDPFQSGSKRLVVHLKINNKAPEAERNFWREEDFDQVDHYVDITLDEGGWVRGTVRRFDEKFDYTFQITQLPKSAALPGTVRVRFGSVEGNLKNSRMTPDKHAIYQGRLKAYGALYVYRDTIRVLPYGRTSIDLLRLEERRTLSAGRYFFSQRRLFGALYITSVSNPRLRDKAGREGFINNAQYRGLVYGISQVLIDLADTYFGSKADRPDKQQRRRERENRQAEAARERIDRETKNFRLRLREWRERLPIVKQQTEARLKDAEASLNSASKHDVGERKMTQVLIECQSNLELLRRFVKESEGALGNEAPAIISLSKDEDEAFDEYLSDREAWQNKAQRRVSRLSALYENLAAKHRTEQERQEVVQARIDRTRQEWHQLLTAASVEFQEAAESVLENKLPLWKTLQVDALDKILLDSLGDNPAGAVVLDGEKAADLEAALGQQLRLARELHLPFWKTLTNQIQHLDQAEAGEIAIGELNRRLESALEREGVFAELAQLGLVVESLDHDYNVLFRHIRDALDKLQKSVMRDKSAQETVDNLQKGFNSLSFKLRLLSPLYRQRQTGIGDVTGAEIFRFIEDLHPPDQRENLKFSSSPLFLNQTITQVNKSVVFSSVANLVGNGFYWTTQSAAPREIRFTSFKKGFVVSDSGPGVSPRDAERIFEPFFGRRPYGRGLGLYIARTNLEATGMEIFLAEERQPRALPGANFIIRKRFIENESDSEVSE